MEHHQICCSFTEWEEKQFFGCKLCKKSRITEYMLLIALIVLYVNDHQVSFSNEWKNKNFLIKCILLLFLIIKTAAGGIMEWNKLILPFYFRKANYWGYSLSSEYITHFFLNKKVILLIFIVCLICLWHYHWLHIKVGILKTRTINNHGNIVQNWYFYEITATTVFLRSFPQKFPFNNKQQITAQHQDL